MRILVDRPFEDGKNYIEAAGLSTDTKPTAGIITGSKFIEADTGDQYLFAEGNSPSWNKVLTALTED